MTSQNTSPAFLSFYKQDSKIFIPVAAIQSITVRDGILFIQTALHTYSIDDAAYENVIEFLEDHSYPVNYEYVYTLGPRILTD